MSLGARMLLRQMGVDVDDMFNPPMRQSDLSHYAINNDHNVNQLIEIIRSQEKRIQKMERIVMTKNIDWSIFREITK